jgi:putative oxidoreductase
MLALGIQTRVVAALMVIEMIAAAYVHAPTFSWADRGMEMPLLMGLVAGSTSRFAVQGR